MFRLLRSKRGQSTLEYAVLIGVIAAVLMIMRVYVKRGAQGSLKKQIDSLGDQFAVGGHSTNEGSEVFSRTREKALANTSGTAYFSQSKASASEEGSDFKDEIWPQGFTPDGGADARQGW